MSQADLAEVWARSLEEFSDLQIEPHQRAWLRLTRPLGLVENTALIATPNEFVKEQLETRLRGLITAALSREFGRSIQLAVTVDPATVTTAATSRSRARTASPRPAVRSHRATWTVVCWPAPPSPTALRSPGATPVATRTSRRSAPSGCTREAGPVASRSGARDCPGCRRQGCPARHTPG